MKSIEFVSLLFAVAMVASAAETPKSLWSAQDVIGDYLASGKTACLSTDSSRPSASRHFSFQADVVLSNEKQKQLGVSTTRINFAAESNRVGCLVSAPDGAPFSYMTSGLMIGFLDEEQPGTLMYVSRGNLRFVLAGAEKDNEFMMLFEFGDDVRESEVTFCVGNAFNPAFINEKQVSFYGLDRELTIFGKQSTQISLVFSESNKVDKFGFDKLLLHKSGSKLLVSDINLDHPPPFPLLRRRRNDFAHLGIPIKELSSRPEYASFARLNFPKNETERRAAMAFKKAFSQPAE